jgi:hypothetical protein
MRSLRGTSALFAVGALLCTRGIGLAAGVTIERHDGVSIWSTIESRVLLKKNSAQAHFIVDDIRGALIVQENEGLVSAGRNFNEWVVVLNEDRVQVQENNNAVIVGDNRDTVRVESNSWSLELLINRKLADVTENDQNGIICVGDNRIGGRVVIHNNIGTVVVCKNAGAVTIGQNALRAKVADCRPGGGGARPVIQRGRGLVECTNALKTLCSC